MANIPRRVVVICNPASGRGSSGRRRQELEKALRDAAPAGSSFEIIETTRPGTAVKTGEMPDGSGAYLAHQAARSGADIVAAAGGDGTVSEVLNGLIGTETTLGILPMGTGNDASRTLGMGTDLALAARTLFQGKPKDLDLGRCGPGCFINIAGCGFDAEVAKAINHKFRSLKGTPAYVAAVLSTLATYKATPIKISWEGGEIEEEIMLCAVANCISYGGGMKVAPNALVDDGLFDVVIVKSCSRTEFLRTFPKVFSGSHLSHPKVTHFRAKKVVLTSQLQVPVLADGEELNHLPITFEILPRALKVMVPN